MTTSKGRLYALGANLCKAALYLIAFGLLVQGLDNLFYIGPYNRLLDLGVGFIVIFALCRTFRAMAKRAERRSDYEDVGYSSAMISPLRRNAGAPMHRGMRVVQKNSEE